MMIQRGRSPHAKSQESRQTTETNMYPRNSSGKSLVNEVPHDSNEAMFFSTDEPNFGLPIPIRAASQSLSPCHSGSSRPEMFIDDSVDSNGSDDQISQTQKAIELIQTKILRTRDLIRDEQTSRDNNVNEYLKLAANAERHQQNRIKQVFEKKNQKSAQSILMLQKKLEDYQKKVKDLENHGVRRSSQNLRMSIKHVGGNIRDGLTGNLSSVMSKPKELAAHLLKNKSGSCENFQDSDLASKDGRKITRGSSPQSRDDPVIPSDSSNEKENRGQCMSDDGAVTSAPVVGRCSGVASESDESVAPAGGGGLSSGHAQFALMSPRHSDHEWKLVLQELTLLKEEVDRLRDDILELKQYFKQEVEMLTYQLHEERDHCDRLEDQIRDLSELHQHEILSIRAVVTDMEEKVQYQSEERLLDIREHLQSLETKVTSIEHQATQQQYLNIEGLDSSDARAIMMKLLTAAITLIHVVLFFLGTFFGLVKPFIRTSGRVIMTSLVVVFSVVVYQKQDWLQESWLNLSTKISQLKQLQAGDNG